MYHSSSLKFASVGTGLYLLVTSGELKCILKLDAKKNLLTLVVVNDFYGRSHFKWQRYRISADLSEQAHNLLKICHKSLPTVLGTGSEWKLVQLGSDWWIICLITN